MNSDYCSIPGIAGSGWGGGGVGELWELDVALVVCPLRWFGNLMFPLWFALLGGSFVFLDMGASILFLVFTHFRVLWFIIYDR